MGAASTSEPLVENCKTRRAIVIYDAHSGANPHYLVTNNGQHIQLSEEDEQKVHAAIANLDDRSNLEQVSQVIASTLNLSTGIQIRTTDSQSKECKWSI